MLQIENNEIFSTDGKYIHRVGSDTYFRRAIVLRSDDLSDFEEVDAVPAYTKAQYDAKVAELVRERYSADEEFALQHKAINAAFSPSVADAEQALSEYAAYNSYVNECKTRAKDSDLYAKIP